MYLSLANKLFQGCLLIWQGKNYLVNEINIINDDQYILVVTLIDHLGNSIPLTCTYDEFKKAVVK